MESDSLSIIVRPAQPEDLDAISEIYDHYVCRTTVTFDTDRGVKRENPEWITKRDAAHPVIVAVDAAARVVAWGSLSPYGTRPAWSRTAEVGAYVHPSLTGRGIGARVLEHLIDEARRLGHHVLVSQIVSENEPSLKSARRAGFRTVGTLHEVGRKFDRWLDVVVMELVLR